MKFNYFAFVIIFFTILLFPPRRTIGEWRDKKTGIVAVGRAKKRLDRWYFGYLPKFTFGYLSKSELIKDGYSKEFSDDKKTYVIEKKIVIVDWIMLLIILLFFTFCLILLVKG